jgi:hypothetical protein
MSASTNTEEGLWIAPELLGTIGNLIPGDKSVISPFHYSKAQPLTLSHVQELRAAGILDQDGSLNAETRGKLGKLALPHAFARFRYACGEARSESTVYFPADAGASVSLTNIGGRMLFRDPADVTGYMTGLADLVGQSTLTSFQFKAALPISTALVMAALVDLRRRALLAELAGDAPFESDSHDVASISAELMKSSSSLLRLCDIIAQIGNAAGTPSTAEIQAALQQLVAEELVQSKGDRFQLGSRPGVLASRFLLMDQALVLEAGREVQGDITAAISFSCLQAGVHDLLFLECTDGVVNLEAISSAVLLQRISFFLTEGDALKKAAEEIARKMAPKTTPPVPLTAPAAVPAFSYANASPAQVMSPQPPAQPAQEAGAVSCLRCSYAIPAGVRFCAGCGAPAERPAAPASTCPNCGVPVKQGTKFCEICGMGLDIQRPAIPPPAASAACRSCGSPMNPGVRFCSLCGISVEPPTAAPALPASPAAVCPRCGTPLKHGYRFCDKCGTPLEQKPFAPEPPASVIACPFCGNTLKPGATFCHKCGTRLG